MDTAPEYSLPAKDAGIPKDRPNESLKKHGFDEIRLGEHMTVRKGANRNHKVKFLLDGTMIQPKQPIGILDFDTSLPFMEDDGNVVAYTRNLYRSGIDSLQTLARLAQNDDTRLEGVTTFFGVSHLAGPLAERLGFETHDIKNPVSRFIVSKIGEKIVELNSSNNQNWQEMKANMKPAREAFISRKRLVEIYGSKPKSTP